MNEDNFIKKFYDEHWLKNYRELEKDDFRNFEIEARNYVLNTLSKSFDDIKNKKLLEVGPGKGHSIIQFAKLGLNVTAIDVSENSLNLCRELVKKNKLGKKIRLVNMDAHDLKFKSNTFDVIFIQTTLMHLNFIKLAERCKNILKKNGLLISQEPLNDNPLIIIYRRLFSEFKETKPKYLKHNDLIKVSKYFDQFTIRGFYLFSFLSLFFRKTSLYYLLSKFLKKTEIKLIKIIPQLERYCWIKVSIYKK